MHKDCCDAVKEFKSENKTTADKLHNKIGNLKKNLIVRSPNRLLMALTCLLRSCTKHLLKYRILKGEGLT